MNIFKKKKFESFFKDYILTLESKLFLQRSNRCADIFNND